MSTLTLHYWKIPGRASLAYLLLKTAGLPVVFVDEDHVPESIKLSYKRSAPFGQLPVLTDSANDVVLAQSAAIAAYAARLTGLEGSGLKGYARTMQYIELEQEIMQTCGKALYTGEKGSVERQQAWEDAKRKVWEKLAKVSDNLGSGVFFTESPEAADFAVAVITWFVSSSGLWASEVHSAFPKLADHYKVLRDRFPLAASTFDEMETWEAYYVI